jgi:hypothetical protein
MTDKTIRIGNEGLDVDPREIVPESIRVEVVETPTGTPLSSYIKRFGGYEGYVMDPFGQTRLVLLSQFRDRDASETRIAIRLHYAPRPSE